MPPTYRELLGAARLLLTTEDASLAASQTDRETCDRRAISSAYYSVFGLLREEAAALVESVVGKTLLTQESGSKFTRCIEHGEAKKVAKQVLTGRVEKASATLAAGDVDLPVFGLVAVPSELRAVLAAFAKLQDERHAADYDFSCTFSHRMAEGILADAERAVRAWHAVRQTPVAKLFLLLLVSGALKERKEETRALPLAASPPP